MISTTPEKVDSAIEHRVARVYERIEDACARAGRRSDSVTLVAVTKTFPVEVVQAAYALGLRHFGENRVQELVEKASALPGKLHGGDVNWHMIGHIQRNKAKDVVATADIVHGLDSLRLAKELNTRASGVDRILPCMVQVNVSGEASKFGLEPNDVPAFLDEICRYENIELVGFMTLAAPAEDPERVRPEFQRLRRILESTRASHASCLSWQYLSMGMSGDFEVAIEEGATHVRVGSALFGMRS